MFWYRRALVAKGVKTKRKCCQSDPRCKRCPVVHERLAKRGLAKRTGKRRYVILEPPTKKQMKRARRR
jgi:hypothetical protein